MDSREYGALPVPIKWIPAMTSGIQSYHPRPMAPAASLEIRPVRNGRGIVAVRRFEPGDLVWRLRGRAVGPAVVWRWWDTDPRRAANCIRFGDELFLDTRGDFGEYANHACRPNAGLFKERRSLALRAVRVIAPGDEVTHDYSTCIGADDVWTMRCNCGERSCRGRVGRFDLLPPATIARYRRGGMIPDFILRTANTMG